MILWSKEAQIRHIVVTHHELFINGMLIDLNNNS